MKLFSVFSIGKSGCERIIAGERQVARSFPDRMHPSSKDYLDNFNLRKYLFEKDDQIYWDIGCRSASHLYEMRSAFSSYGVQYMGINPHLVSPREDLQHETQTQPIPIIESCLEDLWSVKENIDSIGMSRPDLVTMRNTLKSVYHTGGDRGVENALHTLLSLMADDGRLLIYESEGIGLYPRYTRALEKVAKTGINFTLEEITSGNQKRGEHDVYLRVTKRS